jgi:hypothetical protein
MLPRTEIISGEGLVGGAEGACMDTASTVNSSPLIEELAESTWARMNHGFRSMR